MSTATMARSTTPPLIHFDVPVEGMTCASCVGRVEKAIAAVEDVDSVSVNLATQRAHVAVTSGKVDTAAIGLAIRKAG